MSVKHLLRILRRGLIGIFALGFMFSILLAAGRRGKLTAASSRSSDGWIFMPLVFQGTIPNPTPGTAQKLLISELFYDPEPGQNGIEWVEIYNASGSILDLYDYKIGDEETIGEGEGMLRFPAGSSLHPGQVAVVAADANLFAAAFGFSPDFEFADSGSPVLDMLKYAPWTGGNINWTNAGDEVLLLDRLDDVHDALSYGNSVWAFDPSAPDVPTGYSLERRPAAQDSDTAADWSAQPVPSPGSVDLSTPTPTATASPSPTPFMGGLLLSEVFYEPASSQEWIEIYNKTAQAMDLSAFKLGDEETPGGGEGMLRFPDGAAIGPLGVVVVANRASEFQARYNVLPDFEMIDSQPGVPDMLKYPDWSSGSLNLAASGDEVLLLDYDDLLVDAVSWGNSVFAFDPPLPIVEPEHSIARLPADRDTDSASDWRAMADPQPGSVELSTATPNPSATITQRPEPTATQPPSNTPTASASPTPPASATASPAATLSQTPPAPTRTPTPTFTGTLAPTASRTASATALASETPTATASIPASHTPTQQPSLTASPAASATPTSSPTVTPTPSTMPSSTAAPPGGSLLISEVLYDPAAAEPDGEWFEIYNPAAAGQSLAGYKIGDEETQGGGEGMFAFPSGAYIGPGQVAVIARRGDAFTANHGFAPAFELEDSDPAIPDLIKYLAWATGSVTLSNTGDDLLLLDEADGLVDAMSWGSSTWAFDPSAPDVAQGHSLARSPAGADTDTAADWIDQPTPSPGQP